MKAQTQKKENMWNAILNEQSKSKGFQNKNILILGRKGAGKRSMIDGLTDISRTVYPRKNNQDVMAGKLRVKGSATLLDYTYLNVVDLQDPDNGKMNFLMKSHEFQTQCDYVRKGISAISSQHSFERKIIAEHFCGHNVGFAGGQSPWTFMEDLNKWVDVLTEALSKVKINMKAMDEMRHKTVDYVRNFKEYEDKDVTVRVEEDSNTSNVQIPLREGILKTNFGLPLMVVVTKSDIIEQAEKDKDWDSKFEVILYSLRSFCLTYGATLLFTSQKTNTNLNIFYEYILHRLYDMPLRHKSDSQNGESLFIPIGIEDASILKSLYTKFSSDLDYEEKVPIPVGKKVNKEELTVEDNQELLKKLKEKQGTSGTSTKAGLQLNLGQLSEREQEGAPLSSRSLVTPGGINKQSEQLQNFYTKILQPQGKQDQGQMKESAQMELLNRMKSTASTTTKPNLFNADDKAKIQNIIKLPMQPESTKAQSDKIQNLLNFTSTKNDTDAKIKNLLNLSKDTQQS